MKFIPAVLLLLLSVTIDAATLVGSSYVLQDCGDGTYQLMCPSNPSAFAGVPTYPWDPTYSTGTITATTGTTDCTGTEQNPAVIMGGTITGKMTVNGDYCVVDGVTFSGGSGRLLVNGSNVIVRNISIIGVNSSNGMIFSASDSLIENSTFERNQGADKHGINLSCGVTNVWIGENTMRYNGGQGLQTGHNCPDRSYSGLPSGITCGGGPDKVYVYGNTMHNNREGGAATKRACRMVWSDNTITGHRPSIAGQDYTFDNGDVMLGAINGSGGQGYGIAIGAAGATDYALFFDNTYSDNNICARIEEMTTDAVSPDPVAMFVDEDCDGAQNQSYNPSSSPNGFNFDKHGGFIPFCDTDIANVDVGYNSNQLPFNFTISKEGGTVSVNSGGSINSGGSLTYQESPTCDRTATEARFTEIMGHGW